MKDYLISLKLISILANGSFFSCETLSKYFGMNPEAISKHVQILRHWGVDIFTVPKKGYSLLKPMQLLDKAFIRNQIKTGGIEIFSVIDSTNQYLLNRLSKLRSGDVCVSEYQQAGRGSYGKKWFSPFGVNLYFSIYWRLEHQSIEIFGLSTVIAIIIAEVLQKFSSGQVRVKWPNDLYLQNRKLAGILVELVGNTSNIIHLVIGIGINVTMRCYMQKDIIKQSWISLEAVKQNIDRNILLVQLIKELRISLKRLEKNGPTPFFSRWKLFDNFINRPVKFMINGRVIYGISRGIDAQGALLIEQKNGTVNSWSTGKILLAV